MNAFAILSLLAVGATAAPTAPAATAGGHPDRFNVTGPELGAGGFVDGTYADGLPRYFKYYQAGEGKWYERTALPPMSNVNVTGPSTDADCAGTSDAALSVLAYHNNHRAQFGSAPLKWNADMAQRSLDRINAGKINEQATVWVGSQCPVGAVTNWPQQIDAIGPYKMAKHWTNYPWVDPNEGVGCDYMYMAWKEVKEVGCAWGEAKAGLRFGPVQVQCEYTDAGMVYSWDTWIGVDRMAYYNEKIGVWKDRNGLETSRLGWFGL